MRDNQQRIKHSVAASIMKIYPGQRCSTTRRGTTTRQLRSVVLLLLLLTACRAQEPAYYDDYGDQQPEDNLYHDYAARHQDNAK